MPKKFQGVNTKSAEARARKAAVAAGELERKQKEAEDEYWKDENKHAQRKQQRKQVQEQKRMDNLNKKKEIESLYKAEEEALAKTSKNPRTSKVTRAEINAVQKKEEQDKAAEKDDLALQKQNVTVLSDAVEENINQIISQSVVSGNVEARSVEDAISALSTNEELDRHPERRLKASYKKFEQEHMPRLKAANPDLRMSQLRQVLKKEWQKSPENPLNQKHSTYNAK
ncbi:unnamed protein product [Clavelina lepadiformis]|uniref:Coiled-coil domain-containing protein n=1 Tax=Clavelina lepadiformis TaxID=159417 RepID=A0ABP0GGB4_CLALP